MTTKTSEFGARIGTSSSAHDASAQTGITPSAPPTAEQFDRFLVAFADGATHKAAAKAAGLTLSAIAAWREAEEAHEDAYRVARKTRLMALHDALWTEAVIGEPVTNVDGVTRIVRNVRVLERLAVTERELEPEKPSTAVQVNTNVNGQPAVSEELKQFAARNTAKLKELLRRDRTPAAITVDVKPVDRDADIL